MVGFQLCDSITEDEMKAMDKDKYIGELKEDGERIMVIKLGNQISLMNRRGLNKASIYPEITEAVKSLPYDIITLDGEVVTLNGIFTDLQRRALVRDEEEIAKRRITNPVIYRVFDLLKIGEESLSMNPLITRKERLGRLGLKGTLQSVPYFIGEDIITLWNDVKSKNQEGIVIKFKDSIYVGKRSKAWIKCKFVKEIDLKVTSYTQNNAGIRVEDDLGNAIQVSGGQSKIVKNMIDSSGSCLISIRYLEIMDSGRFRFPAFHKVVDL